MDTILIVGVIICAGFIFGEAAERLKFPKVTGYIIAGVLLSPNTFGMIPANFTAHTDPITNIALSVVTFSVGGTLFYPRLKVLGKSVLYITVLEAEVAFVAVAVGFSLLAPFFIHIPGADWLTVILPFSLLIAALASPTDPTATLAVAHEYKAKGDVSSTIMAAAAFDDVLGLLNYSLATVAALALVAHKAFSLYSSFVTPCAIIIKSILFGVGFGYLFNTISRIVRKETEGVLIVLIIGLLSLCFGMAHLLGADELLATMIMGIVVVNFSEQREKVFGILGRYMEELIFLIFFTLSGMHLNPHLLVSNAALVFLFVILRAAGKVAGTKIGARLSDAPPAVRKYTAGGLIPQGGIVIGLALMIKQNPAFSSISSVILNLTIGTAVIHEIIGPFLSKLMLVKAGEING